MVDSQLTCQYCGEQFETKSDLQDHEMNCLEAGQGQAQKQQQTGKAQQTTGAQRQTTGSRQTTKSQSTGNRTRGAGSGESWNKEESGI